MKKILVFVILGLNFYFAYSKENDPVVMTVAGKDIPLSEFLFLAQKDSSVDLLDKKSLEDYVTLFKNFKLKVAEAESLSIDQTYAFEDELNNYQTQLKASYLSDKEGEARALNEVYERNNEIVSVSHILFPLPAQSISKDTLAGYNKAYEVYKRIANGEDFDAVGQSLAAEENSGTVYETIDYLYPLKAYKAFEDAAYSLPVGVVSTPVRTAFGFHLMRVNRRIPNPGKIQVAHILIAEPPESAGPKDVLEKMFMDKVNEVYEKAKSGEDFAALVHTYSADDKSNTQEGVLPYFGLGEMIRPFEQAAFTLKTPGEISEPVRTRLGYHIIKLLNRKERVPFEEMERGMYITMKQGERNFDLYKSFEERQKAKFGYVLNQDAYDDLQRLCDKYFPTDTAFYNEARMMMKTLMHMDTMDFPQYEFAEYLRLYPFSTKTYSGDFLNEVYRLFIRDIVTELEKRTLDERHPEFNQLVKEYHDGILLFEISNQRVWNKPLEEQAQLEAAWIRELNEKFPVEINWKVLKNLKKIIRKTPRK
ncbi:MAG: peptidylprolyl isomerase [Tannerella sp.]|jgi:peptidyl-prolyl cis-trans isomerase SurA|nr:peptidylprolyl isomerase [Tannerella sp.]